MNYIQSVLAIIFLNFVFGQFPVAGFYNIEANCPYKVLNKSRVALDLLAPYTIANVIS